MRLLLALILVTACDHATLCADCASAPPDLGGCGTLARACCGDDGCAAGTFCETSRQCWPCYNCDNDPSCGCCGAAGQSCCLSLGATVTCRAGLSCVQDGTQYGSCQ